MWFFWQWFQQCVILSGLILQSESKWMLFAYNVVPLIPPCHNHTFFLFFTSGSDNILTKASVLLILALGVSKQIIYAPIRKHYHCRVRFLITRHRHWNLCLEWNSHCWKIANYANFKNTMQGISALHIQQYLQFDTCSS